MTDKVIHFQSRKPFETFVEEEIKKLETEADTNDAVRDLDRVNCEELLDSAKTLVTGGRLSGLIVIGMDPVTDLFFNEIRLDGPLITREMMFSYIGILETLKSELMEFARMAPTINRIGDIVNAYDEEDEEMQ